jgi:hypothetical protein
MTTGKGTSCAHTLLYIGRKLLFNCLQWNSLSSSPCRWPSPSKHVNSFHISMGPSMSTHFPSGWSFAAHILVLLKLLDVMNSTCRRYGLQELTSFWTFVGIALECSILNTSLSSFVYTYMCLWSFRCIFGAS